MDLSIDHLRKFLLHYVESSPSVVSLWIRHDSEYLLKKLEDKTLWDLIVYIQENDLQTTLFLKQVLCSVRSDGIRKAAGTKLYAFAKEAVPEPYDHEACIRRFLPTFFSQTVPHAEPKVCFEKIKPSYRKHVVQEGESLWKIARLYRVDLDLLIKENGLDPDICLRVGRELAIP
jgi:LysM repeat protein